MRVPAAITLLVFSSLIQCTTCTCNITCTTDYISSLNCSCPGPTLASDYHLEAECRDEDENISDSTTLKLYENIKLRPPFNISLTVCKDSYNVSWKMDSDDYIYFNGYMVYRVRTRIKGEAKPSYHYVYEDRQYLEIPSSVLQSEKDYEVDVQARVNPHRIETGFWSEWSSSAKWRTKRSPTENKNIFYKTEPGEEGNGKDYWQYCFLLLIVAPCLLCFFGTRRLWLRKVHVYIPSPEIFFRPLYHAYEGDFKKWVGPTFTLSETDCLEGSTAVSVVKEKQAKSLERLCDIEGEDGASTSSSPFLGMASLSSSKQSSEDCGHSPGNSGNAALGLLAARCRWDAVLSGGRVSGGAGSSEGPSSRLALDCLEPRPRHDGSEPDQSSLESFSFTEHSEDGYPAVTLDMDTIDSGFLESDCSSPVHSDPDVREKMDAPVLVGSFHTNYVKQWVANTDPSAPQEDSES
ncbi:hypothetical protein ANANG_G00039350 [Anguilla anguilla]|uniref:Fibronectin type-III domain-containing protein n=1 Tax=Anguilla anguilla TaxID=7936 RepID=A0A9D3MTE7_ANGAN|nr:hypothetical protein ANANG_G00039350 [Anguilla anguilla]